MRLVVPKSVWTLNMFKKPPFKKPKMASMSYI
jgi:hypothetical protein